MTDSADFTAEASDTDLADQALPAGDDEVDAAPGDMAAVEADPADVFEQHQSVPADEDDYDR